jgi:competence protein ComEC
MWDWIHQNGVDSRWTARLGLPRLTPLRAASMLGGAVAVQALPVLPAAWIAIVIGIAAFVLLFVRGGDRSPVWFVLGFAWTLLRADAVLESRLPEDLHGRDFVAVGTVRELPQIVEGSTRFEFDIESASLAGDAVDLGGRVRLNWYANAPELAPCSRWTLVLRLRAPRGLVNPGGHDAERSAAQRGIIAAGYVRDSAENQLVQAPQALCIDGWRRSIGNAIAAQLGPGSSNALLRALAVGDQQAIGEADWQVLRATGIGHLIAISGLHVSMFAAFGAWIARGLWKLRPRVTLRLPAPLFEAPFAMACALGYGLLAGMGLPTLRTLLMIAIALLARYTRRAASVPQALGLAAVAIVIWDPLAVLSAGFWLSFVGVAILLSMTTPVGDERAPWREMPRVQLLLSVALLPLTVWFFGQGSLIGPLANLLAVPWISFIVVPVTVAASLLLVWLPVIGAPLLQAAEWLLMPLWRVMEWMAALPSAQKYFAAAPAWTFALALIGVAWSLLPRGVPARSLGLLLVLPMLVPARKDLADGEFEAWMFDVGQGLSVFVRTREHALLYDAGPRYPGGFDVGDVAVVPSLRALGIDRLDRMIISHGDSDHAGGARAVSLAFPEARIDSGEPGRTAVAAQACIPGDTWLWNGVRLSVVFAASDEGLKSNDRSCVLAISGAYGTLLLTGDATLRIEPAIASSLGTVPRPLVLSVSHHGSKTASSAGFLDALAPELGLVSAGYRNRFGHPHADVVARYAARSIPLLGTAENGYLHLRFTAAAEPPERGREARATWWRMR